ncbi:hypothetical protein ARMGADRAFT_1027394 [Armillaria gallica]|uniref:Uncharacterized protein n=1 Tax=Armillaria gallica TaxID=47427 RepID=A0A2H3E9F0_ARMGA|nr:hypothetical protein ARMGADRAFT_1027394 [Armillaria gallica]
MLLPPTVLQAIVECLFFFWISLEREDKGIFLIDGCDKSHEPVEAIGKTRRPLLCVFNEPLFRLSVLLVDAVQRKAVVLYENGGSKTAVGAVTKYESHLERAACKDRRECYEKMISRLQDRLLISSVLTKKMISRQYRVKKRCVTDDAVLGANTSER